MCDWISSAMSDFRSDALAGIGRLTIVLSRSPAVLGAGEPKNSLIRTHPVAQACLSAHVVQGEPPTQSGSVGCSRCARAAVRAAVSSSSLCFASNRLYSPPVPSWVVLLAISRYGTESSTLRASCSINWVGSVIWSLSSCVFLEVLANFRVQFPKLRQFWLACGNSFCSHLNSEPN